MLLMIDNYDSFTWNLVQYLQALGAEVRVERNDALVHLNQKVESALVRAGLPREERRYSPHVTLARLRDAPQERVGRFIQDRGLFRAGPIRVEHFTLFESRPGSGGPVYDPLREYPLG